LKSPLKEGVLKYNCGVPIVFVINKSDTEVEYIEKKDLEENSEFILSHIRRLALEYGATIIYNSGKTNINLTVLYDYICHVLFNFELAHKPNFIEKEAYFIPAGYDDLKTLNSNEEIKKYLNEPYEKRIKHEIKETQIIEEDIQCEDTNTFFEDLKKMEQDNIDSKNKAVDLKKANIRNEQIDKDKKFKEKREFISKQLKHQQSEGREIKDLNVVKENKKDTTAEDEKKKYTREQMLSKIKMKFPKKK
jgi:hypothetical protein